MTAPVLISSGVQGLALDDALAAAADAWQGHCLLELDAGRIAAHHVLPGWVSETVVEAVLTKQVSALEGNRTRLRTVGLLGGAPVVMGVLNTDEAVMSVPLGPSATGQLWVITTSPITFDHRKATRLIDRIWRAHEDGIDQFSLDGAALADCLRDGAVLPSHLVGGEPLVRLLGLRVDDVDPRALELVVRRCSLPHLGAAAMGDALFVLLVDDADASSAADRIRALVRGHGPEVRAALSGALQTGTPLARARDQVLALLPVAVADGVARVEDHSAWLVLEQLRSSLETAAALVHDPLEPLSRAGSREPDFRRTLLTWLDAHGDVQRAASEEGVHVNTMRYRLRRAFDLLGQDLSDPTARLDVHLRLRLLARSDQPAERHP